MLGRNVSVKIWNKLTHGNFDIYSLCVTSLHCKMTPILFSISQRKILMSHFRQFFCDDDTVIEVARLETVAFEKDAKKLARRQDEAEALKAYENIIIVFYYVIFVHKLDIIKRNMSRVCKFSQLKYCQILLQEVPLPRRAQRVRVHRA